MTVFCPHCGAKCEDQDVFCVVCGNLIQVTASCEGCGVAIPISAAFCPNCGINFIEHPEKVIKLSLQEEPMLADKEKGHECNHSFEKTALIEEIKSDKSGTEKAERSIFGMFLKRIVNRSEGIRREREQGVSSPTDPQRDEESIETEVSVTHDEEQIADRPTRQRRIWTWPQQHRIKPREEDEPEEDICDVDGENEDSRTEDDKRECRRPATQWFNKREEKNRIEALRFQEIANYDGYYDDKLPYDYGEADTKSNQFSVIAVILLIIGLSAFVVVAIKLQSMF